MEKNTLFRKNALDQIQSPENLNEYIKVTKPSVWVVLSAIIVLLVSLVVWGVFGTVTLNDSDGNATTIHPIEFITR